MRPVILVSAPWASLRSPSIQLGRLKAFLDRRAVPCLTHSLSVDWMQFMTARLPEADRFSVAEYESVAMSARSLGLGDWAFALPPVRHVADARDAAYFDFIRQRGAPDDLVRKVAAARGLSMAFLMEWAERIAAADPLLVGFSSTFSQTPASLVLAHLVKTRAPAATTVFGGSNCEGPMGAALHRLFPWIDVVVRGPGEQALADIAGALAAGGAVRGSDAVLVRGGRPAGAAPDDCVIDLDELPVPDYDEYFERIEGTGLGADLAPLIDIPFESARGCWWGAKHQCTFCGLNGAATTFRSRSPERVLDDIRTLATRYRRRRLAAVDNIMDQRHFDSLLPKLREQDYDLDLFYEVKGNLTRSQVQLLRDSGVRRIQPGLESLSTPILRLMRKGITALQNVRLLKWCAEFGVEPDWNIIYGIPGEPPEEYARMAAAVPSLVHLKPPFMTRLIVERFSPYQVDAEHFGVVLLGPEPLQRFLYDAGDADLEDLGHSYAYAYADGRDPDGYAGPLRQAASEWHDRHAGASLRCFVAPGHVEVVDDRDREDRLIVTLEGWQAAAYLALDRGATAPAIRSALQALRHDVPEPALLSFLRECDERGLVYCEEGKYLSLAVGTGKAARHVMPA